MENHYKALDETIVLGRIAAGPHLNSSNGPTERRMPFGRWFVQLKYIPVIRVHPIFLSAPHRRQRCARPGVPPSGSRAAPRDSCRIAAVRL
jgi:hypothetical protein